MELTLEQIVAKAGNVLEDAFQYMLEHQRRLPDDFDTKIGFALRDEQGDPMHSTDLKWVIRKLAHHPKYVYVAVRYMEQWCAPMEFKRPLDKINAITNIWSHWPKEAPLGLEGLALDFD